MTADRVQTTNLQADSRVTLHVSSKDFWTWVAVEGTAEYRSAMVADRRLVVRFTPEHTYGQVRG